MSISYVGRISPPNIPVPPEAALYWDYVGGNLYGSQPGSGQWALIGGNSVIPNVPIIQVSSDQASATAPASFSITAVTSVMYQISLYMETEGLQAANHTVTATLTWTSPNQADSIANVLHLDGGHVQIFETYPLLASAGTSITMAFSYGGGATNDPYTYGLRIVQMP